MKASASKPPEGPWAIQRRHARYALTLTAVYRVPEAPGGPVAPPRPGETANVSEGGACLLLPERLRPATGLDLLIRGEAALYAFRAEVVWAAPAEHSPVSHGVRLEAFSPADQVAWELLLFEQHQRGSQRAVRIVVDLPALCLVDARPSPLPGEVQNVGVGGLLIRLPELLPVGTAVTVTIQSPLQLLNLSGRVAWSQARPGERAAHGVAFTDMKAGREALQAPLSRKPGLVEPPDTGRQCWDPACPPPSAASRPRPRRLASSQKRIPVPTP